ncbi:MAG: hypothetical protein HYZ28_04650 [Myxococcales bacterium]|nr:hypothetical protein [Myxococcales bacterium]
MRVLKRLSPQTSSAARRNNLPAPKNPKLKQDSEPSVSRKVSVFERAPGSPPVVQLAQPPRPEAAPASIRPQSAVKAALARVKLRLVEVRREQPSAPAPAPQRASSGPAASSATGAVGRVEARALAARAVVVTSLAAAKPSLLKRAVQSLKTSSAKTAKAQPQPKAVQPKKKKKKGLFGKIKGAVKKAAGGLKKVAGKIGQAAKKVGQAVAKAAKKVVNSKVFNVALSVASFIPGPVGIAARVVQGVKAVVSAIKSKNLLQGITGVAAAVAGGAGAIAGRAAATVARVATAVGNGARAVQAGILAAKAKNLSGVLGAVASGAAAVAGAVGAGAEGLSRRLNQVATWAGRGAQASTAFDAARRGDLARALAAGSTLASSFPGGRAAEVVGRVSSGVSTVQAVREGIRNGDFLGAVSSAALGAGGLTQGTARAALERVAGYANTAASVRSAIGTGDYLAAGSALAGLASSSVGNPVLAQRLSTASSLMGDAGAIQAALRGRDYVHAASLASQLASRLSGQQLVGDAGRLLEGAFALERAVRSGDVQAIAAAGSELRRNLGEVADRVRQRAVPAPGELPAVEITPSVVDIRTPLTLREVRPLPLAAEPGPEASPATSPATAARIRSTPRPAPANELQGPPGLDRLTASQSFQRLSPTTQRKVVSLYGELDQTGRDRLRTLVDRQVNGRSAVIDADARGGMLIDHLASLAHGAPLTSQIAHLNGTPRRELVNLLLAELANPGEINQSYRGTCTVTTLQYELVRRDPAEYARLMVGLMSPSGRVEMRNGDTLRRVGNSIAPDDARSRTITERLFQSAMMEYGNGVLLSYSNGRTIGDEAHTLPLVRLPLGYGLANANLANAYNAVFGGSHRAVAASTPEAKDALLGRLTQTRPGEAAVSLRWGHSGHELNFERVAGGRVFLRNPHGFESGRAGRDSTDPFPHRVETSDGLISMTIDEFKRQLTGAVLPDRTRG